MGDRKMVDQPIEEQNVQEVETAPANQQQVTSAAEKFRSKRAQPSMLGENIQEQHFDITKYSSKTEGGAQRPESGPPSRGMQQLAYQSVQHLVQNPSAESSPLY